MQGQIPLVQLLESPLVLDYWSQDIKVLHAVWNKTNWQKGSQLSSTIYSRCFISDMYMYVIQENCFGPAFTYIAAMNFFFKTATHHLRGMYLVI